MDTIHVKCLRPGAVLPAYGSTGAAGADLTACIEKPLVIEPGQTVFVPTGIAMEVPEHCAGLVYARSGMACKQGLAPANKVGVIDSDYRGRSWWLCTTMGRRHAPWSRVSVSPRCSLRLC